MKSNMGVVEWPKVCTRRESENVNLFPRSYHLTATEKSDFTTTWPWRVWIRDYENVEGGVGGGGKRLLGRKKENLYPTHPLKLMRRNLSPRTSNNSTFFHHQQCSSYGSFSRILMILFYKQNERNFNSTESYEGSWHVKRCQSRFSLGTRQL